MLDLAADMVTAADFDLDGRLEYVVGRVASRQLMVFSSWFGDDECQATIELNSQPVALTHGDFDGDGVPEIAVALADARVELLVSDQNLNFSLAATLHLPATPCDMAGASPSDVTRVIRSDTSAMPWSSETLSPRLTRSSTARTVSAVGARMLTCGAASPRTSISRGGGTSGTAPSGPDARHMSRVERDATNRPLKV